MPDPLWNGPPRRFEVGPVDHIRAGLGEYYNGTGDQRRAAKEQAPGWVATLLGRIDELEAELRQVRSQQTPVVMETGDDDPATCRCNAVSRPPCGPCENGTVV